MADWRAGGRALFVAMATGQNAANLPPILEMARPGDRVLWLETNAARTRQWARGSRDVLEARGIPSVEPPLGVPDAPGELAAVLRAALAEHTDLQPVFVHNGGPKLAALAIDRAVPGTRTPILYGQEAPSELWLFPTGIDGPMQRRRYTHRSLTLPEILQCTGHAIAEPDRGYTGAVRFWPDALSPTDDRYGVDPGATAEAHRAEADRTAERATLGSVAARYRGAVTHAPTAVARWAEILWRSSRAMHAGAHDTPADWTAFARQQADQLSGVFDRAVRTAVDAMHHAHNGTGLLGRRFEAAVARRAHAWLDGHHAAVGVHEAWLNVRIVRPGAEPARRVAEWDITFVLSNAILATLECKSFSVQAKELEASLFRLQSAATRPSQLWLCMPDYPRFSASQWYGGLRDSARTIRAIYPTWLPFTLPGEPVGDPGAGPVDFEAGLDRLLGRFASGG